MPTARLRRAFKEKLRYLRFLLFDFLPRKREQQTPPSRDGGTIGRGTLCGCNDHSDPNHLHVDRFALRLRFECSITNRIGTRGACAPQAKIAASYSSARFATLGCRSRHTATTARATMIPTETSMNLCSAIIHGAAEREIKTIIARVMLA